MFPTVARALGQMCVCATGSTLKGINDEMDIRSYTKLFDQDMYVIILHAKHITVLLKPETKYIKSVHE
jgi:hypothetical protein